MLKLFFTFFKIGLFTFGGGYAMIPLINEEINEFNIDAYTFSDFIAISESTPGPFAINIATFVGYDYAGILGALSATIGVILPSFLVMLLISMFINQIKNTRFFKVFLKISTPIILGLILSSTLKITSLNLFNISSINSIKNEFSINLITIISFSIISMLTLIYYLIKKKKLSPFIIIIMSCICGFTSYLVSSFLASFLYI